MDKIKERLFLTVTEFRGRASKNALFDDVSNKIISKTEDIDEEYLQYHRDWSLIANTIVGTEIREPEGNEGESFGYDGLFDIDIPD